MAVVFGLPATRAGATAPIASLTAESPISAGQGWILWSAPSGGAWVLEGSHDGTVTTLAAAPRPQPFDVQVGTDATGAPVATFSRCTRTPTYRGEADPDSPGPVGGVLLIPSTGAGCRIHLLPLDGGKERLLAVPHPRRTSDTTPSMWHGQLTFARRSPQHGRTWQIMSWSSAHPRRLTTLRHGAEPQDCTPVTAVCRERPNSGEVEALDRDGSIVVFLWQIYGHSLPLGGATELRVDSVNGRRVGLLAGTGSHEACTQPVIKPHELEYVNAEPPLALGSNALEPQLESYSCFESFSSRLGDFRLGEHETAWGELAEPILALAEEKGTLYALIPQPDTARLDSPVCSQASPCSLEAIPTPSLGSREAPYRPLA